MTTHDSMRKLIPSCGVQAELRSPPTIPWGYRGIMSLKDTRNSNSALINYMRGEPDLFAKQFHFALTILGESTRVIYKLHLMLRFSLFVICPDRIECEQMKSLASITIL